MLSLISQISDQIDEEKIFDEPTRKKEVIQVLLQTMEAYGFKESVGVLKRESNVTTESGLLSDFKQSVLSGQWDQAMNLLSQTGIHKKNLLDGRCMILEQKYLESIELGEYEKSVFLMRNELQALLEQSENQLLFYTLSSLLLASNLHDIQSKINYYQGCNESGRQHLFNRIAESCQIPQLLRPGTLQRLIKESHLFQSLCCPNHLLVSNPEEYSLFNDHICQPIAPPTQLIFSAKEHKFQVILAKWSHSGSILVTVGQEKEREREVIFWDFAKNPSKSNSPLSVNHRISDQQKRLFGQINAVEFDQFDRYVVFGFEESRIALFDVNSHSLVSDITKQTFPHAPSHQSPVLALAFHPMSNNLYSAGADPYIQIYSNNTKSFVKKIEMDKTKDMLFTKDGSLLVMMCACKPLINIFDTSSETIIKTIKEKDSILSMNISSNDKFLLTNTSLIEPEVHMWSLDSTSCELIRIFKGHQQISYVLQCSFGGFHDDFIVQGSESGAICVWNTNNNKHMTHIKAHNRPVNAVIFHPVYQNMMLSVSDDLYVRLWDNKSKENTKKQTKTNGKSDQQDEGDIAGQIEGNEENILEEGMVLPAQTVVSALSEMAAQRRQINEQQERVLQEIENEDEEEEDDEEDVEEDDDEEEEEDEFDEEDEDEDLIDQSNEDQIEEEDNDDTQQEEENSEDQQHE